MPRKHLYHTREEQRLANNVKAKRWRDKNSHYIKQQQQAKLKAKQEERYIFDLIDIIYTLIGYGGTCIRARDERRRQKKERRKQEKEKAERERLKRNDESRCVEARNIAQAKRLFEQFTSRVEAKQNKYGLLEDIYETYITPVPYEGYHTTDFFDDVLEPFSRVLESLAMIRDKVYRQYGVTEGYNEISSYMEEAREVVRLIEDLYCHALTSSILELQEIHSSKKFMYQG
ncbi:hypothetical protein PM082_021099 [Marasmius tenuissimus]|nr:hypothetical protein PM082_021099 [Marasmius tenuissimus]